MAVKSLKWVVCLLAVFFVGVFIFRSSISADSALGKPVSTKNIKITINNKSETFILEKYSSDKTSQYYIVKKDFFGKREAFLLSGFEDEIVNCDQSSGKISNAICLVGAVGVHSQNVQLVGFKDGHFSKISFIGNGESSDSAVTDVPKFAFSDLNNDGNIDLMLDQRDYDTDPLTNSIRNRYYRDGTNFIFDGSENIPYN